MLNFYFYLETIQFGNHVFGNVHSYCCVNKYAFDKLKQKNTPWKAGGWYGRISIHDFNW